MTQFPLLSRSASRKATRGLVVVFIIGCLFFVLEKSGLGRPRFEYNFIPIPIRPEQYPVLQTIPLPRSRAKTIPKIQHAPVPELPAAKVAREARLQEVKDAFLHGWAGYKKEAWAKDELRPITGGFKSPFCGWAATMVDSLDTLWIMGLKEEFEEGLIELRTIDFTNTEGCQINLFETTIRHLGGLLSAYDISGGKYTILVEKAVELGEILYTAFDTTNRMPTAHYLWSATDETKHDHQPSRNVVLAVLGSLSLEFTRLSQVTGNDKYYDAIQRVMNELEKWQMETSLPGMWPAMVDADVMNETSLLGSAYAGDEQYTLGALADSTYEYLPKQYLLLGGQKAAKQYRSMYEKFIPVAKKSLMFRPMTITDEDLLIFGTVHLQGTQPPRYVPELQHLACFTGGMLAIAGKIFNRPEDVLDGGKLANGCVWAYKNTPTGIMPETVLTIPCASTTNCTWDTDAWYRAVYPSVDDAAIVREDINLKKLSPGFVRIMDGRYLLRPEAIESVFIMHRITADPYWAESGWNMFRSIVAHTKTDLAHSAIDNVMSPAPLQVDECESFWFAETLKYFFLLFSESSVVNLDEYVLNTEAHPLKRPR